MTGWSQDSRRFQPQLTAAVQEDGTRQVLLSPAVGYWRDPPAPGSLVRPGATVGQLEILGVLHRLVAPAGVYGLVTADDGPRLARRAVAFGQTLLVVDTQALGATQADAAATGAKGGDQASGLQVRAPSSGRFYARPAPDQPTFVAPGDVVEAGRTLGLLEIMKTFHRLTYGEAGMPERARILRMLVQDGADLDSGMPIFEVEPVEP